MKKKRIIQYLAVITSLIALSVVTPLIIRSASDWIVKRVTARNRGPEIDETPDTPMTEKDTEEAVSENGEQQENEAEETQGRTEQETDPDVFPETKSPETKPGTVAQTEKQTGSAGEPGYYNPPEYASREDEGRANEEAYEVMREKVLSEGEAAAAYREAFSPAYDELTEGLMKQFISGNEKLFYAELANYCFGHYNTTHEIAMVRFDALLEDTGTKTTVILEFFTREDVGNALHTPDLALCTYNRNTNAFVFFQSAGR